MNRGKMTDTQDTMEEIFTNPPIVEAILDIRCAYATTPTLNALAVVQDNIKTEFPKSRQHIAWSGKVR